MDIRAQVLTLCIQTRQVLTHIPHQLIMVQLRRITLPIRLQVLYLELVLNQQLQGNAPQVTTGCFLREVNQVGVWLIATRICLLAHLIIPGELQPLKQDHIIVAVSLMTPLQNDVKMALVQEDFTGMGANVWQVIIYPESLPEAALMAAHLTSMVALQVITGMEANV